MTDLKYAIYNIAQLVLLLFAILTFLFVLFRSLPGSYADQLVFRGAPPAQVAELEAKWGINEPLYVQYFNYLRNLLTGDAGTSLAYRQPVVEVVKDNFANTIILAFPPIVLGYVFGVIVGTIMGTNRGSIIEKYGILPLFAFGTVPSFFLAVIAVWVFALNLGWFPTSGMTSIGGLQENIQFWEVYLSVDFLWHYTLPFTVIFLRYTFLPTVLMRTSVVDTLGEDFIFYQRVTGLPRFERFKSVVKHSSLPIITMFPLSMTRAIGGLVLIELVFGWPGIGVELVEAVNNRDYPVAQFAFFIIAAVVVSLNALVDVVYSFIDPRVGVNSD
jgi:peptide/nickel transport system permease protein